MTAGGLFAPRFLFKKNVDLDQHRRYPSCVQPFASEAHSPQVIVNASPSDERALIIPHNGVEERRE